MLVIADGRGPVGLAGIMGGQSTAVDRVERLDLLRSGLFCTGGDRRARPTISVCTPTPRCVSSAASTRAQQARAIERATELLLEICGGEAGPLVVAEDQAHVPQRDEVVLRRERLEGLLGMSLADAQVEAALEGLQMQLERGRGSGESRRPRFASTSQSRRTSWKRCREWSATIAFPSRPASRRSGWGSPPSSASTPIVRSISSSPAATRKSSPTASSIPSSKRP